MFESEGTRVEGAAMREAASLVKMNTGAKPSTATKMKAARLTMRHPSVFYKLALLAPGGPVFDGYPDLRCRNRPP